VGNMERASELDPRNAFTLNELSLIYFFVRAYQQAGDALDRALALKPNDIATKVDRALLETSWRADTRPLHAVIEKILADDPAQAENADLKGARFCLALYERDPVAADRAAGAFSEKTPLNDDFEWSRAFWAGLVARMKGDAAAAHAAFTSARTDQEAVVRARPDFGPLLSGLGVIDAGLGRKQEAIREGRRALELTPIAKDSLAGPEVVSCLAIIYAWTGERDLAIEQLEIVTKIPGSVSYGELRLDPFWDPLRGDPRFDKIVASLAPKEVVSK